MFVLVLLLRYSFSPKGDINVCRIHPSPHWLADQVRASVARELPLHPGTEAMVDRL